MNKIGIGFLSGALGILIGSIGSYIFFKKKCESMYYEELHKAIDEECENIRLQHQKIMRENEGKVTSPVEVPEVISNVVAHSNTPYHNMLNIVNETIDPDVVDGTEGPEFITEDVFASLSQKYEIRELQLLRGDWTMLDDNDELVDESNLYISGLEEELKKVPHLEHVYILIERMSIAVDLVLLDDSYANFLD